MQDDHWEDGTESDESFTDDTEDSLDSSEFGPQEKAFTDEAVEQLVDEVLKALDKNDDGYVEYVEFVAERKTHFSQWFWAVAVLQCLFLINQ